MKWIYLALSIFFFQHILRDYLQEKGVKNWYTEFAHFWDAPKYNEGGMVVFLLLGILFLYLAIRQF